MGTGWGVKTHLTLRVITTLPGAEYLGEVNSWSRSQKKAAEKQGEVEFLQKERIRGQGPGLPPRLLSGQSISGPPG